MFINNITGKPIKDISFEGFYFTIPVGVSVCWDKFGDFLFSKIYKIDGEAGGMPPVTKAVAAQWKGDRFVEVRRFPINAELIPSRTDLLKIAKKRGVDAVTLETWQEDETIENAEIVKTINELAVPEEIAYPKVEVTQADANSVADTSAAEAALNNDSNKVTDPASDNVPQTTEKKAEPAKVPTVGGSKSGKTGATKRAAKKAPATPKTAKK